jgi:hypothetical protein
MFFHQKALIGEVKVGEPDGGPTPPPVQTRKR